MQKILVIFLIYCFQLAKSDGDDGDIHTIQYDSENFSSEVPKNNHFIMFYAPWCGHCKRLHPTWEQLAEMLNEEDSNIRIAKVDCTTDNKVCSEQDITGYPTLKFFKQGSLEGVKFRGTRDLPSLTSFINEQLRSVDENDSGHDGAQVPSLVNALVELTEDTFEKYVSKGNHFVKFYAPWCGHCQKFASLWEYVAEKLESNKELTVAKIDCTLHRTICNQFNIKGYPTLLWIKDGKMIDRYQGQRNQESLFEYINKMLGTSEKYTDSKEENIEELESPVLVLNEENFEKEIENGVTLVKFFAPWCGHCKRLAPIWIELAKKFLGQKDVKIAKVDCTSEPNKACKEVNKFPMVFIYKNGAKVGEYDGNRSLEDLQEFVTKYLDKHDEL